MLVKPVKPERPDRSKINIASASEIKWWARSLGVSKDVLLKAIEKVGNSAVTVRKELNKERDL